MRPALTGRDLRLAPCMAPRAPSALGAYTGLRSRRCPSAQRGPGQVSPPTREITLTNRKPVDPRTRPPYLAALKRFTAIDGGDRVVIEKGDWVAPDHTIVK